MAKGYAERAWGDGAHAEIAALWHDLGKFNFDWQVYLDKKVARRPTTQVQHAIVGSIHTERMMDKGHDEYACMAIGMAISGHHTGLPNRIGKDKSTYLRRLFDPDAGALYAKAMASPFVPSGLDSLPVPRLPEWATKSDFSRALFTRMLLSVLVDADRNHARECATGTSTADGPTFSDAKRKFDAFIEQVLERGRSRPSVLNAERARLLSDCVTAARGPRGLYTLTAPTGLGKTLSGAAFAMEHLSLRDGDETRRFIYIAPFISIIEQNADVFKQAMGSEGILEHHSTVIDDHPDEMEPDSIDPELARENWDAPFIVTTAVQFFESLFAARTRRVRKLHNIANSVIFVDEAHALPPHVLIPCCKVLRELIDHYGCTVVLSTATQPDLAEKPLDRFEGLPDATEIVSDVHKLFHLVKGRVTIDDRKDTPPEEWPVLAAEFEQHDQAMFIVNTKRGARELHEALAGRNAHHLSGNMCASHRTAVLGRVKSDLIRNANVLLVTTSLVEAGVDIDFPVVYRAASGLDSLAQSAGRCNREGRLSNGRFIVVPTNEVTSHIDPNIEAMRQTLHNPAAPDFFDPLNFRDYYARIYGHRNRLNEGTGYHPLDRKNILHKTADESYRDIEAAFKLILEDTACVVVPYGQEGRAAVNLVRAVAAGQRHQGLDIFKVVQPFMVSIRRSKAQRAGFEWVEALGLFCADSYHPTYGLETDEGDFTGN